MIVRMAGLALDARAATRTRDPHQLAVAARWIAANALAIRRIRIVVDGTAPARSCVFGVRIGTLTGVLAAIAAVPALVDATTLPRRWRLALEALGVPVVDRPIEQVLASGVSIMSASRAAADCMVEVEPSAAGFRVHLASTARMLVA